MIIWRTLSSFQKSLLTILGGTILGIMLGFGLILALNRVRIPVRDTIDDLAGPIAQGKSAPNFSLFNLYGKEVALKQRRDKAVLLNFWATWCIPCELEMPLLEKFHQEFDQDLVILAVNDGESKETVQAYVDDLGLDFEVLLDPDAKVQEMYRVLGYPTSILIDTDGKIAAVHIGVLTESQLTDYLSLLGIGKVE